jgi:hypothetical protein
LSSNGSSAPPGTPGCIHLKRKLQTLQAMIDKILPGFATLDLSAWADENHPFDFAQDRLLPPGAGWPRSATRGLAHPPASLFSLPIEQLKGEAGLGPRVERVQPRRGFSFPS